MAKFIKTSDARPDKSADNNIIPLSDQDVATISGAYLREHLESLQIHKLMIEKSRQDFLRHGYDAADESMAYHFEMMNSLDPMEEDEKVLEDYQRQLEQELGTICRQSYKSHGGKQLRETFAEFKSSATIADCGPIHPVLQRTLDMETAYKSSRAQNIKRPRTRKEPATSAAPKSHTAPITVPTAPPKPQPRQQTSALAAVALKPPPATQIPLYRPPHSRMPTSDRINMHEHHFTERR
jgi:hypothetical protein